VGEEVDHVEIEGLHYVLQGTVGSANEKGPAVITLFDRERVVRVAVMRWAPGAKLSSVLFIVF